MNFKESEIKIDDLRKFYTNEINRAIAKIGGPEKLAIALNYSNTYLYNSLLKRRSVMALRRIVKKIYDGGIIE